MNGQPISGLNEPTEATQAANKGYVDGSIDDAILYISTAAVTLSLPASGWAGDSAPYTQTVTMNVLTDLRRVMFYPAYGDNIDTNLAMRDACACVSYADRNGENVTFTCLEDKPSVDINVIAEVYV